MRFVKENDFVEISEGVSCDQNNGPVWFVKSNIELSKLPIEFRGQVSTSDLQRVEELRRVVSSWAQKNNYVLVE